MKKILAVLLCFFVLSTSVFAEDVEPSGGQSSEVINSLSEKVDALVDSVSSLADKAVSENTDGQSSSEVSPGNNTIYVLNQPSADDSEVVENAGIDTVNDTITDINFYSSVAPVTPADTTGLKAVLLGLLGNYDPVVVEYQYQSSQGYNNYLREVQPDYVWLCSFALLALMIFCIFKLGGALLRG